MKPIIMLLCLLPTLVLGRCPQLPPTEVFSETLAVHAAQENVGLAVLMARGTAPIASLDRGEAVVEYELAVDANTRFLIMSVTKAFIGAALVKTVGAGLLDLDTPIGEWLPGYVSAGGQADQRAAITLRQLASHTAGVPHLGHPDRKALYVEHFADARAAVAAFADRPLLHAPGSAYAYSSSGYNLIAALLETVHDAPIDTVVQRLVLEPLALDDTMFGDVLRPTPSLARGYSYIDLWTYEPVEALQQVPTWDFSYNPGGGNMISTAQDLARFGAAFLEPGFFSDAEFALFAEPINTELSPWTFGWFVREGAGDVPSLSISGATPGVQAGMLVDRSSKMILVALANAWGRGSAGGDLVIGAPGRDLERYLDRCGDVP